MGQLFPEDRAFPGTGGLQAALELGLGLLDALRELAGRLLRGDAPLQLLGVVGAGLVEKPGEGGARRRERRLAGDDAIAQLAGPALQGLAPLARGAVGLAALAQPRQRGDALFVAHRRGRLSESVGVRGGQHGVDLRTPARHLAIEPQALGVQSIAIAQGVRALAHVVQERHRLVGRAASRNAHLRLPAGERRCLLLEPGLRGAPALDGRFVLRVERGLPRSGAAQLVDQARRAGRAFAVLVESVLAGDEALLDLPGSGRLARTGTELLEKPPRLVPQAGQLLAAFEDRLFLQAARAGLRATAPLEHHPARYGHRRRHPAQHQGPLPSTGADEHRAQARDSEQQQHHRHHTGERPAAGLVPGEQRRPALEIQLGFAQPGQQRTQAAQGLGAGAQDRGVGPRLLGRLPRQLRHLLATALLRGGRQADGGGLLAQSLAAAVEPRLEAAQLVAKHLAARRDGPQQRELRLVEIRPQAREHGTDACIALPLQAVDLVHARGLAPMQREPLVQGRHPGPHGPGRLVQAQLALLGGHLALLFPQRREPRPVALHLL